MMSQLTLDQQRAETPSAFTPTQGGALTAPQPAVITHLPPESQKTDVMELIRLGIDRQISPDALAKLYELHQRVQADNARRAFREAMVAFQATCPRIGKDRDGLKTKSGSVVSRYATLEHISERIRETMERCGLSYTFDTDLGTDGVRVVCWIHHRDGHSEKSQFTSAAVGTDLMNKAQMLASASSYGKRYSLCNALGIVIAEEDDDGANSAPPAAPTQRADAPVTQPRADRVTAAQCKSLYDTWAEMLRANAIKPADADWVKLVSECTGIAADKVFKADHWTVADLQAVAARIQVPF